MCCKTVKRKNTGNKGGALAPGVLRLPIFVPYFDSNGNVNGIDLNANLDQAYADGKINAVNSLDRFFPLPPIEDPDIVRAEASTKTYSSGLSVVTQKGIKSYTMTIISVSPRFEEVIDSFRCGALGIFGVDLCGNIDGKKVREGWLDPIRINEGSLRVEPAFAKGDGIFELVVKFDISISEQDKNIEVLTSDQFEFDALSLTGLDDMYMNVVSSSAAGFVADFYLKNGSAIGGEPVSGLIAADFDGVNVTVPATPTPSPFSTVAPIGGVQGRYQFDYTTPVASADKVRLDTKVGAVTTLIFKGYDFTNVNGTVIETP